MAVMPKRPCAFPGCRRLVESGRCAEHAAVQRRLSEARRMDDPETRRIRGMYKSVKWQALRAAYLTANPWCKHCLPRLVPATDVDHVTPHRGDWSLFLSRRNLQGLCHSCHSRKTAREDGGFGNRPLSPELVWGAP